MPKHQEAVAFVKAGASYGEAAEKFGLTRGQVSGACHRAGVKVPLDDRKLAKIVAACKSPAAKEKRRQTYKQMFSDPAFREAWRQRHIERMSDPVIRERISQANRKRFENPASRARISKAVTALWKNPEYRQRNMKARWNKLCSEAA